MNSLTEAGIVMAAAGTCIYTGDFNSHDVNHKILFNKMLRTLHLEDMHNPICTKKDKHWTFQGHAGKSCPDHILIPTSMSNKKNTFWVYQEHDCGSDHRLMQAKIVFNKLDNETWGTHENHKCDWEKVTWVSPGVTLTSKEIYQNRSG